MYHGRCTIEPISLYFSVMLTMNHLRNESFCKALELAKTTSPKQVGVIGVTAIIYEEVKLSENPRLKKFILYHVLLLLRLGVHRLWPEWEYI